MPTLHSHTPWQGPQADTQAKACQKVCLPNTEKKKVKISFLLKILKMPPYSRHKNGISISTRRTEKTL